MTGLRIWRFKVRVGLVKEAERISRTRKLIKLLVDFGDEERVVVAGTGDQYSPEDLKGGKMIFVTNLKPRQVAGVESQAMLIVAEDSAGRDKLCRVQRSNAKTWIRQAHSISILNSTQSKKIPTETLKDLETRNSFSTLNNPKAPGMTL